jgi:hypothetical protein
MSKAAATNLLRKEPAKVRLSPRADTPTKSKAREAIAAAKSAEQFADKKDKNGTLRTMPREEERLYSGLLMKKRIVGTTEMWHRRLAVLTRERLAFSSFDGRTPFPKDVPITSDMVRGKFDEYDHDKNGKLDVREIKRCLAELGQESVDVELIMSLFDTDRSGFLEWDEFQDFVCYTSWSNAMLDFIPLAEIERVSYTIRNKSLALPRDETLSPSPSRGPSSPPAGNNAPPVQQTENSTNTIMTRTAQFFSFRGIIKMLEHYTGLDFDGDGQNSSIPAIDHSEEVQLIITTIEGGHNAGKSYVYTPENLCTHDSRCNHGASQRWLDLLLEHSEKERKKRKDLVMREEVGHNCFLIFRAKSKRFYESSLLQYSTAFLVVGAFMMDASEAQLLPEAGICIH